MLQIFRYRISLSVRPYRARTPHAGSRHRSAILLAILGALGMNCLFLMPAAAATGSVSATVNIAVISLTVSPGALTLGTCSGGNSTATQLGFPNGQCQGGPATITNTGAASHISLEGTNAVPFDNGTQWKLCPAGPLTLNGITLPTCAPSPGQDQFTMAVQGSQTQYVFPTSALDGNFGAGSGAATAGQSVTEAVALQGPSSSTDQSNSFTATITWIAGL